MDLFAVDEVFQNEIIINKSRFITTLVPVKDKDDASEHLKIIKKRYSDATHNCYAYISDLKGLEQRFSDDGEPQGTAGIPMLDILKKKNIYLTLAVVTRYFGGIKLGANGLVLAYSNSVSEALSKAKLVRYIESDRYLVTVEYSIYSKVEEYIRSNNAMIENVEFNDKVILKIVTPSDITIEIKNNIKELSLGRVVYTDIDKGFNKFKI